jgi:hypothetical protein
MSGTFRDVIDGLPASSHPPLQEWIETGEEAAGTGWAIQPGARRSGLDDGCAPAHELLLQSVVASMRCREIFRAIGGIGKVALQNV